MSTDSGSTGLNLQNASVVVNCDLPWNPAKFEQRIARAWRKHQTRPVTVINLVSEKTIEHRMLETLANKQALADGVLDQRGDLSQIKFRGGREAFLAKLEQMVGPGARPAGEPDKKRQLPADRARGFAERARNQLKEALVRCEEVYLHEANHSLLMVVVDRNAQAHQPALAALHEEFFPREQTDPLSPVKFEVIDRETDEALKRLMENGVITINQRAVRRLFPEQPEPIQPLTSEEQVRIEQFRVRAARRLKMARLLKEAGLEEEGVDPLKESLLLIAKAWALQSRLPEPEDLIGATEGLFSDCWKEQIGLVRDFVAGGKPAWAQIRSLVEQQLSFQENGRNR